MENELQRLRFRIRQLEREVRALRATPAPPAEEPKPSDSGRQRARRGRWAIRIPSPEIGSRQPVRAEPGS